MPAKHDEGVTMDTQDIWERFGQRLRRFILPRVGSEADTDDILQDVFYKAHSGIHTLESADKLEAWIYRITRNAIIDYYRHRGKMIPLLPGVQEETAATDDPAETPEEILSCLRPMIAALPEKYGQAILLTEYQGLTQKEVAESLGVSPSGAKSRVQRARGRLKEMLLECCHFEFDRLGNILEYQPKGVCPHCTSGLEPS